MKQLNQQSVISESNVLSTRWQMVPLCHSKC